MEKWILVGDALFGFARMLVDVSTPKEFVRCSEMTFHMAWKTLLPIYILHMSQSVLLLNFGLDLLLLFLQVDALTTKRGKEGGWVVERLLNQV